MQDESRTDIEKQRKHFDEVAQHYVVMKNNAKFIRVTDAIWRYLFAQIDFKGERLAVLDAMCGAAFGYDLCVKYLRQPFIYEGFDYSENMVALARRKHPDLYIYHQDITTFSPQKQYDIVIIIGGLHHVYAHRLKAVQNIAASLKPGGIFINWEPTHNNRLFGEVRSLLYKRSPQFDADTERDFTTDELNLLMQRCGFSVETQIWPGLLAYILWGNPNVFPRLNRGSPWLVEKIVGAEKFFWRTKLARWFSFLTVTAWRKTLAVQVKYSPDTLP